MMFRWPGFHAYEQAHRLQGTFYEVSLHLGSFGGYSKKLLVMWGTWPGIRIFGRLDALMIPLTKDRVLLKLTKKNAIGWACLVS